MQAILRYSLVVVVFSIACFSQAASNRIQLTFDTSEAEAVLAIMARHNSAQPITDSEWQRLFATTPYIRLKQREASMKRDFTDDEFKQFVLAPETLKRGPELRRTLDAWKRADLNAAGRRILAFLPSDAVVKAKVYPVIKPRPNTFVYDVANDPTIFFYLDPERSAEVFENTAAHELHHIGYSSVEHRYEVELKKLPANMQPAAEWVGAFGEGMAMLAAAGSADVHPHRYSSAEDRERWDRDMANFNQDLRTVDQFFLDVIHGKFASSDDINKRAFEFFGVQGPWYTVGYRMAAEVEKQLGREALLACTDDPRKLLATWNSLAEQHNRAANADRLASWSAELLSALGANPLSR